MTKLLEKALKEASKLPDGDQDALAAVLLEELASKEHWQEQFSGGQEKLSSLADEALRDLQRGRTKPLNLDIDT